MSDVVKAVLIFLAGQASIFGLEWFRAWNSGRNDRLNRRVARDDDSIAKFQTVLFEIETLINRYGHERFLWEKHHPDAEFVDDAFQLAHVPAIRLAIVRLRVAGMATRSDEIRIAFNLLTPAVQKIVDGSTRRAESSIDLLERYSSITTLLDLYSENALFVTESTRKPRKLNFSIDDVREQQLLYEIRQELEQQIDREHATDIT